MDYPSKIIMMGEQDAALVKQIQIRLNELGCGPVDVDGVYGKQTALGVKAFQSRHCDLYDFPLIIDGKVGVLTWYQLFGGWLSITRAYSPLIQNASPALHSMPAMPFPYLPMKAPPSY